MIDKIYLMLKECPNVDAEHFLRTYADLMVQELEEAGMLREGEPENGDRNE